MTDASSYGTSIPWDSIEREFRTTNKPVRLLAKEFRVSARALQERIARYGWRRNNRAAAGAPAPKLTSPTLAAKLSQIARSQIGELDRQMTQASAQKEDNVLRLQQIQTLVRLIKEIAGVERKNENAEHRATGEPAIADDAWRLELARRLEGLRRQSEFEVSSPRR